MQRGYEEDAVLVLKLVVQLTQQFPVGIVNQHKNSWPPVGKMVVSSRERRAGGQRLRHLDCRSVVGALPPEVPVKGLPGSGGNSLS